MENLALEAGFWQLLAFRIGDMGLLAAGAAALLPLLALLNWGHRRLGYPQQPPGSSGRSLQTDLGYLVSSPLSDLLARCLTTLGIAGCAFLFELDLNSEALSGFGPVIQQPRWLVISEMLLLSDLVYYWTHRLAHTVPLLWRFHAVHHSTQYMRWSAAVRTHPMEAYALVINMVPLFALGFPVDALLPIAPVTFLYAMLIHTDMGTPPRAVAFIVNSPGYHRIHHALDVRGNGLNFAGFFPFYDFIFGTYHFPDGEPVAVGIHEEQMPETWLAQLAYPFKSRRVQGAQSADS